MVFSWKEQQKEDIRMKKERLRIYLKHGDLHKADMLKLKLKRLEK